MTEFARLGDDFDAAVIGASGGIGRALAEALADAPGVARLHVLSRSGEVPQGPRIRRGRIDITDERSVAEAARELSEAVKGEGGLRLVIVATGLLHDGEGFQPEKTWRDLDPDRLARSFAVNATGPALVARHLLPVIPRRAPAIFAAISARVGSISDNRAGGWYGYRASKAALNQILRCLAIEEGRRRADLVIAGLQPGTVRTGLSRPFRGSVPDDELLEPAEAAAGLLDTLAGLTPADSGGLFDWRGEPFDP